AAFARRLARSRYDLILIARRSDLLESLAVDLRTPHAINVEVLPADLADDADVRRVAERVQEIEDLWMLVHSAGFGTMGSFVDNDAESQASMVQVHDVAAVRLTRAALPTMIARGHGAIIHVSSIA